MGWSYSSRRCSWSTFWLRETSIRENIYVLYVTMLYRGNFTFITSIGNNMWWQQDGAPAHTSNVTMQYLREQFPLRLMSKSGGWPWPPRSPDLAIFDFFLWGYIKQQIWDVPQDQQPQNLEELRISIVAIATPLRQWFHGRGTAFVLEDTSLRTNKTSFCK